MASITIKAKSVDYRQIWLGAPRSIIGNNFSFPVRYGSGVLTVQLPRCQLYTGLYESDGKFYCEVLVPSDGVAYEMYLRLVSIVETQCKSIDRFGSATFIGHARSVSCGTDTGSSCIRLKLPQNKSQIITKLFDKDSMKPVPLSSLQKGTRVVPVVSIEHAYVVNNILGFNLLLKELLVVGATPRDPSM